ncbi:AcrR family transcriptional regulator [Sphingobium sp. B11D3B]|uniref:TetR/AcrR family transcriptional regulator n=1 Tax=Sphingobium sp. B11D3B TaxID=2940575 RepID=UPI00222792F5|nr:TetR/AcrR family transcriptional regulator [Sphingobium sp. B11D3B]MCW2389631.1 AcrR family transcriptional regulator [Sphingobium sp. B11D3B]
MIGMTRRKERAGELGTRQRILLAALEEFSANGFSGARIDRIIKIADVNVRMVYHFFGNKKGLLEAVLAEIFKERRQMLAQQPSNLSELLDSYFAGYAADRHRVRLLEWEALENGANEDGLSTFQDRRRVVEERIETLRQLQAEGNFAQGIDPQMLFLFCVALSIYPMSFPQSVYVATGEDVYSDDFQARYRAALGQLSSLLAPASEKKS